MKKLAIAAAVLVILLSACDNPFARRSSKPGPVKSGTVTVTFGNKIGAKKLARTIVPDIVASADSFTVTLTSKNGYAAKTSANIAPGVGQAVFVGVEAGTWNVSVTAYMSTFAVASGEYDSLVLGADATQSATVYLSPNSGSGAGSIDLPVAVDGTANVMDVTLQNPGSSLTTETPVTLSGTPASGEISILSLPAGTYSLIMNILDGSTSLGTFRESVSVYANLMSNMWVASNGSLINCRTFLSTDLLVNNTELSNLVISGEAAGDIPDLIAFDSTITSYDEGTVVKGSSISFTPTRSIDGQKITYTWNGGSAIGIVSGSSSGALALAGGTNTLVVNVTAPNKVTTNSYTFTLQNVPNYTNSLNMQMVYVTGGTYFMGSDTLQDDSSVPIYQSKPVHQVTVSDFMLGKYPVTQAQYYAVMQSYPLNNSGGDLPVMNVSRSDAMTFCNALSVEEGLQKVYPEPITGSTMPDWTKNGYRLPSDAEYEFAARGGSLSKNYTYPGSNNPDDVAWYNGSVGTIQTVGKKLPNELGLYDMAGNVFEFTEDWIQTYSDGQGYLQEYDRTPKADPLAPYRLYDDNSYAANVAYRSMRGGSISSHAFEVNSAYRENIDPSASSGELGFRVARGVRPLLRMLPIQAGTEPSTGMNVSAFQMSETEITQAQFKRVMGFNPSLSSSVGDDFPVGDVTWYDALSFCNKLSAMEGLQSVYTIYNVVMDVSAYANDIESASVSADFTKNGYRLPTNSERIWAARGGTTSTYYWGSDAATGYAWYGTNSSGECHSVGHMSPNVYGLYDMSGNDWEWGWGSDNVYLQTPQRYGGAYNIPQAAIDALASTRGDLSAGYAGGSQGYWDNGFRVVKGATRSSQTMVAYANDTASDSLIVYNINSGTGAFSPYTSYPIPSTGPSGLALAPNMKALYSTWQGSSLIYAHAVDPSTGALSLLGTQGTGSGPGPISITPNSKYLYVLDTGDNTIYWYSILSNGNLNPGSSIATGVTNSTAQACVMVINRAGTYLFVGHDNPIDTTDGITVFSIDPATGSLSMVGSPISTSALGVDSLAISHDGLYLFICENGDSGVVETATINGDGSLSPSTGNPKATGTAWQDGISLDTQGKFIYIKRIPPYQGLWVGSVSSTDGSVSFSGMNFNDGNGVGCGYYGPLSFDPTGRFAYSPTIDSSGYHYLVAYAQDPTTGYLSIINDTTSDAIKPNAVVVGSLP